MLQQLLSPVTNTLGFVGNTIDNLTDGIPVLDTLGNVAGGVLNAPRYGNTSYMRPETLDAIDSMVMDAGMPPQPAGPAYTSAGGTPPFVPSDDPRIFGSRSLGLLGQQVRPAIDFLAKAGNIADSLDPYGRGDRGVFTLAQLASPLMDDFGGLIHGVGDIFSRRTNQVRPQSAQPVATPATPAMPATPAVDPFAEPQPPDPNKWQDKRSDQGTNPLTGAETPSGASVTGVPTLDTTEIDAALKSIQTPEGDAATARERLEDQKRELEDIDELSELSRGVSESQRALDMAREMAKDPRNLKIPPEPADDILLPQGYTPALNPDGTRKYAPNGGPLYNNPDGTPAYSVNPEQDANDLIDAAANGTPEQVEAAAQAARQMGGPAAEQAVRQEAAESNPVLRGSAVSGTITANTMPTGSGVSGIVGANTLSPNADFDALEGPRIPNADFDALEANPLVGSGTSGTVVADTRSPEAQATQNIDELIAVEERLEAISNQLQSGEISVTEFSEQYNDLIDRRNALQNQVGSGMSKRGIEADTRFGYGDSKEGIKANTFPIVPEGMSMETDQDGNPVFVPIEPDMPIDENGNPIYDIPNPLVPPTGEGMSPLGLDADTTDQALNVDTRSPLAPSEDIAIPEDDGGDGSILRNLTAGAIAGGSAYLNKKLNEFPPSEAKRLRQRISMASSKETIQELVDELDKTKPEQTQKSSGKKLSPQERKFNKRRQGQINKTRKIATERLAKVGDMSKTRQWTGDKLYKLRTKLASNPKLFKQVQKVLKLGGPTGGVMLLYDILEESGAFTEPYKAPPMEDMSAEDLQRFRAMGGI